ncbi:hypothetical protein NLX86_18265 [Streptomyces sp. A3M-1-3]|uniref:hypothetical protein n=1 Tax=Streptomyces sp. A3M-1-3 TaxID=2962044 RepID=UPI0020B71E96|nr:hypothetical protein [Streptomyces sp. A3M-1-3]MCP3819970.1 hypothetical protein [Streptomyces sp. A3M-1-3]
MRRHEFQPGRLVAGVSLLITGVAFAGDAGAAWETPWYALIPLVVGGLSLAAVTGVVALAVRRRHRGAG